MLKAPAMFGIYPGGKGTIGYERRVADISSGSAGKLDLGGDLEQEDGCLSFRRVEAGLQAAARGICYPFIFEERVSFFGGA